MGILDELNQRNPVPAVDDIPRQSYSNGAGSSRLLVREWLLDNGYQVTHEKPLDDGVAFILSRCPFNLDHKGTEVAITQRASGQLGFKCQHNSCSQYHWKDARDAIGKPKGHHWFPPRSNKSPSHDGSSVPADDRPEITALDVMTFKQMREAFPKLREPIIDGICREGETVNVIAATKVGKSWLSMDLAMSIALGRKWIGQFETRQGRVLLIDNELHPESLSGRLESVRFARNHDIDELNQAFDVVSLRGKVENLNRLALQLEQIEPGRYTAIIIDAFYRTLPNGTSESDNGAMTALYNVVDRLANRLKCVFIIVHHASKGAQGDKAVTDVGSGAGSMSRATDTHLVIRPHEEQGYAVLEAAVRSFPPLDPVTIFYKHPLWEISGLEAKVASSQSRGAARQKALNDEAAGVLRKVMGNGGRWTVGKLHQKTGMSEGRIAKTLLAMENELETARKKSTANGKRCVFYRLKTLSNQGANQESFSRG